MRHGLMVTLQSLEVNKINCRIKVRKIIRHINDGVFDLFLICPIFKDNITLTTMFFTGLSLWARPATHQIHSVFCRDGVLHSILYAWHATHCILMPLSKPIYQKSICLTCGKDSLGYHAV